MANQVHYGPRIMEIDFAQSHGEVRNDCIPGPPQGWEAWVRQVLPQAWKCVETILAGVHAANNQDSPGSFQYPGDLTYEDVVLSYRHQLSRICLGSHPYLGSLGASCLSTALTGVLYGDMEKLAAELLPEWWARVDTLDRDTVRAVMENMDISHLQHDHRGLFWEDYFVDGVRWGLAVALTASNTIGWPPEPTDACGFDNDPRVNFFQMQLARVKLVEDYIYSSNSGTIAATRINPPVTLSYRGATVFYNRYPLNVAWWEPESGDIVLTPGLQTPAAKADYLLWWAERLRHRARLDFSASGEPADPQVIVAYGWIDLR